jgi:hypothetical protein
MIVSFLKYFITTRANACLLTIIFTWIFVLKVVGQSAPPEPDEKPSIQGPEASSFGKFGTIPVSLFNGSVQVSVPIVELTSGDVSTPVVLSYDASGCRPATHPGWVGLNWTMLAGGIINRQANGRNDECRFGYMESRSALAAANWLDPNYFKTLHGVDFSPDEFMFVINGITGSFLLNHDGTWVVKSKDDPNIKITHEYSSDYPLANLAGAGNYVGVRTITKFTLTTSDGTKYVFGGTAAAIEFSFPAIASKIESYNFGGPPGPGQGIQYCFETDSYMDCPRVVENIQSSAWRLSEIITPDGRSVKFYYDQALSLHSAMYTSIGVTNHFTQSPRKTYDVNVSDYYAVHTSYLNRIEFDNNVSCKFYKSLSHELPVELNGRLQSGHSIGKYSYNISDARYFRLDSIEVLVNGVVSKRVSLGYIDNPSERLKLSRVRFHFQDNRKVSHEYGFTYNPEKLPAYNAAQEDHWGYFNGKNFWGSNVTGQFVTTVPPLSQYVASRDPDPVLMDAEILTEIKFPTGGYSRFTYEPHDYSKLVVQNPSLTLTALTANKTGGGLRIKRVDSYDNRSGQPVTKEYFYNTSYLNGGTLSSGILSGEPCYFDEVSNSDGFSSKFSSLPMNYRNTTNGNHITYSEVTEKSGEGYTVYRYTNHDNGFPDRNAFTVRSPDKFAVGYQKLFANLELERGLVKSVSDYAADKFLLKHVVNNYNDDPARYNIYVRACQVSGGAFPYNWFMFPVYNFNPFLKNTATTEYNRNGTALTTLVSYDYEPTYTLLRKSTTTQSDGTITKQEYSYPFDILGGSTINEAGANSLRELLANNMVSQPVEVRTVNSRTGQDYVTGSTVTLFKELKPAKVLKASITDPVPVVSFKGAYLDATGLKTDSRYETFLTIDRYDDKGNMLQTTDRNGLGTVYLWGYKSTYPICKVVNASYDQVETAIGTSMINVLKGYNSENYVLANLNPLRTALPNAQVFTYSYVPLTGMATQVDPNNRVERFEYDYMSRLKHVRDDENNIVRSLEYGYYRERLISGSPSSVDFGLVERSAIVDKPFKVTNLGNQSITIVGIQAPSGYSLVAPVLIPTGVTKDVYIRFAPTTHGVYNGTATLLADADNSVTVSVSGQCNPTRILTVSPTSFAFGAVEMGTTRVVPVTLSNSGDGVLTVSGVTAPLGYALSWTSGTIGPGQSLVVNLTYRPPSTGTYSGTVTISSDKTSGNNTISVTGTGTPRTRP